jgi:hypothetical protein
MAEGAKVGDIESIARFRVALIKYAEAIEVALGDAESDVTRTQLWLELEQLSYWEGEIRKRHDALERAKEALRMKKLFKDASGRQQSAIDEEKEVKKRTALMEEAVTKLANTRKYIKVMQREAQNYKGGVQRLSSVIHDDLPTAAGVLAGYLDKLHEYLGLSAETAASTAGTSSQAGPLAGDGGASMKRAVEEEIAKADAEAPKTEEEKAADAAGEKGEAEKSKE